MRRCQAFGCDEDISDGYQSRRYCSMECRRKQASRRQRKRWLGDRQARAEHNARNAANYERHKADDPDFLERRAAAARERRRDDPEHRERLNARDRERRRDPDVMERRREQQRQRYANDPDLRAKRIAYLRRWRARRRAEREHARRPGHCSLELVDFCWCWEHHRRPRDRPSAPDSPLHALRDWLQGC